MPFLSTDKKAFFVTLGDYVTTVDGTGIVHTAPAFGEDDYQTGRRYDLPVLNPVGEDGKYTETPWKGRFVMEDGLDIDIIKYLAAEKKLFFKEKIAHNYPHCWRCGTPLIYYAKPSWYIEMTKLRDQLVENNNTVNWQPPFVGEGRFGNWIADVKTGRFQKSILGYADSGVEMNAAIWNASVPARNWWKKLRKTSIRASSFTVRM